ncbi:MAG: hypothetical protein PHC29_08470 [Candidatus Omnitrophica bacterium]|jgi:hypothetical protein|nr:hypothetical protein [Candidatus Omnitrophota bacterium]
MKPKKCKDCGREFIQYNSLQNKCIKCLLKQVKEKKAKKRDSFKKIIEPDKLKRKADRLFQEVGKKKFPRSIISGEPTEVIHHFVYKSGSNATRYDWDNAIPLTNREHQKIHENKNQGTIALEIVSRKGVDWQKRLLDKSKIMVKLTENYLEEIIKELTE